MTLLVRAPLQPPEITEEIFRRFDAVLEGDGIATEQAARITAVATKGDIGLPGTLMAALPALNMIAVYGVGLDAIDLQQARARGIRIATTPDVLTDAVAELAIGLMLAAARRIVEGDRFVRAGRWAHETFDLGWSLRGETVGILGYGRIGRRIGELARVLGMKVLYTDLAPVPGQEDAFRDNPTSLAEDARILVVAAAGGADTRCLVDGGVLRALGPDGLLVNVARGSVVADEDLIAALDGGQLGAAALDVFTDEPNVPPALLRHQNVIATPHVASATRNARLAMGRLVIENLAAFYDGRPLPTPVDLR